MDGCQVLERLKVHTHGDTNMFATLFWGVIDFEDKTISYVNCGHEEVVVVGSQGIKRTIKPTGPAVGISPHLTFESNYIEIETGDLVIAFTDGITAARNVAGEMIGRAKLMKLLSIRDMSADRMLNRIVASLAAHTEGAEQSDDITLMVVRRC